MYNLNPRRRRMSEEQVKENLVEIPVEEEVSDEPEISITEGMSVEEISEAKELGLIEEAEVVEKEEEDGKEDKEDDEEEEGDEEDKSEKVDEEKVNDDPDNFEEMDEVFDKNEKKFHKTFTPNAKALYFKMKSGKARVKTLVAEVEELKKAQDPSSKAHKAKLDKIDKLLKSGEDLTIEQIQGIISEKAEIEETVKAPTQEALKAKVATKTQYIGQIGRAKYENFNDLAQLADEVVKADKTGVMEAKIGDAFLNDAIDETEAVNIILKIAKFHDKFDEVSKSVKAEKKEKDSRVIKNSKKKVSSAAVGGSKGRLVSEDDLTVEEAVALSERDPEAFNKLSPKTMERLLGKN